jgi:hypothetical protein
MFIKYSKSNLHVMSSHDGKEVYWLKPGWNEFPLHIWDAHKDHPETLRLMGEGSIEISQDKVSLVNPRGKKEVVSLGKTDQPVRLKDLDERRAIEIVGSTFDRGILQRWLDEENRSKVKRAVEKQLKPLLNDGTSSE